MNRWNLDDVAAVVNRPQPQGLVDLWNETPDGYELPADALRGLRKTYQTSIAQGLALLNQKAIARAGVAVGFRPEVFQQLANLPFADVVAETAVAALEGRLNMGTLTSASQKVLAEILERVGSSTGAPLALASYSEAIGQVVAVVWFAVETIVNAERVWNEHEQAQVLAALDCIPPAYSARGDLALAESAVELLGQPDWSDLFLPLVRPVADNGDELGFACCISTVDHGRVIAPVGSGVGNRIQSAFAPDGGQYKDWQPPVYGSSLGFGCLPMCGRLPVHRAIVIPGGGQAHLTYDPAESLAQLAGVGVTAWHMLWGGGPAAFTVDGAGIASAWIEYLSIMRRQIGGNAAGFGTHMAPHGRVCDDWSAEGRRRALEWLYSRIGVPARYADPDGIYMFDDALPVKAWRQFELYQGALLGYHSDPNVPKGWPRLVAAYVDDRTCHPAWRERVALAHQELLEHPDAVCRMDLDSIANENYRAAVYERRRQKGAWCYAVAGKDVAARGVSATTGPSLDPLGEEQPEIPAMPSLPAPPRASSSGSGGAGGALAVALLLGGAFFLFGRSR